MSVDEQKAIERTKRIIDICGGHDSVAKIVGRSRSRIHSWTYGPEKYGTGGVIPARCQLQLLEYARANGLKLFPEDFFPPAEKDAA